MQPDLAVDVDVMRGEFDLSVEFVAPAGVTVLFGPSGAGKSTVLDVVAGLVEPRRGAVRLGDRSLFDAAAGVAIPAPRRRVGYVFQSLALFPHLSVIQNVIYGVDRRSSLAQRRGRGLTLLERLGVGALADRTPGSLSGGERQRVAIARALGVDPDVMLLDEPFAALDRPRRRDLAALVRSLSAERGIPVLFVTHDHEEAETIGDHVLMMQSGRIVSRGAPIDVLDAPPPGAAAGSVGWENQFDGVVKEILDQDGALRVEVAGVPLTTRPADVPVGAPVTVSLRAADVVLFLDEPGRMSASNVVRGTIVSIDPVGRALTVTLSAGELKLRAQITPGAQRRLSLTTGSTVWAVFKARACHARADLTPTARAFTEPLSLRRPG